MVQVEKEAVLQCKDQGSSSPPPQIYLEKKKVVEYLKKWQNKIEYLIVQPQMSKS